MTEKPIFQCSYCGKEFPGIWKEGKIIEPEVLAKLLVNLEKAESLRESLEKEKTVLKASIAYYSCFNSGRWTVPEELKSIKTHTGYRLSCCYD